MYLRFLYISANSTGYTRIVDFAARRANYKRAKLIPRTKFPHETNAFKLSHEVYRLLCTNKVVRIDLSDLRKFTWMEEMSKRMKAKWPV